MRQGKCGGLHFFCSLNTHYCHLKPCRFQIMERKTIAYRLSKLKRNHLFQCQPLTDEERDVLNAAIMELRKSEFKQNLHKK